MNKEKLVDRWIDELITIGQYTPESKGKIDKHYIEVVEKIKKEILIKLCTNTK